MQPKVSACVITLNEEQKVRRCLQSLTWCDEIVVLDSFSTDRTIDICREFTIRVYQHEWLGYVAQRNLVRDMARYPWILFLDADEEVSPGLREEIRMEFERGASLYVGYEFPRQVYYVGRWIRHGEWYPDIKLRLFAKEYGRTEGQEPHDKVVVNGPVKRLTHPLWHYTYDDVADHLATINRFSSITARQRYVQNSPFRWHDLIFRPILRFFKGYLMRRGFMDGAHGFVIAILCAYGVFVKYAKQWEMEQRNRKDFRGLPQA
jgi:glycosyltransferase involved in cell wall biosynthesis